MGTGKYMHDSFLYIVSIAYLYAFCPPQPWDRTLVLLDEAKFRVRTRSPCLECPKEMYHVICGWINVRK